MAEKRLLIWKFIACMMLSLLLIMPVLAQAKTPSSHTLRKKVTRPAKPAIHAALLVDAKTGHIIHEQNAGHKRPPASLTKMMTLYLTFEAVRNRTLQLNQMLPVSAKAAAAQPSNLGLMRGDRISVREAIMALIVKSANDVAIVLAEAIKGDEASFAREMTARSHMLGMKDTIFKNASGLPNSQQTTTAYDMAKLGMALRRDFPNEYRLFSNTCFHFKGRLVEGHNRITKHYPGADGLKTGYTAAAGFNIVSSASRGDHRAIAVVMGGKTAADRDKHTRALLDNFFKKKQTPTVLARNDEYKPRASTLKKRPQRRESAALEIEVD